MAQKTRGFVVGRKNKVVAWCFDFVRFLLCSRFSLFAKAVQLGLACPLGSLASPAISRLNISRLNISSSSFLLQAEVTSLLLTLCVPFMIPF